MAKEPIITPPTMPHMPSLINYSTSTTIYTQGIEGLHSIRRRRHGLMDALPVHHLVIKQMAQQEGGWPLGLQPLNVRIGFARSRNVSGSVNSFSTLITASPTLSSASSSDLEDAESTGSFFRDRSITLGSLIGITSILDLSSRSRRSSTRAEIPRTRKNRKAKASWLISLCNAKAQVSSAAAPPSLGHFLRAERRVSSASTHQARRSDDVSIAYEVLDELPQRQSAAAPAASAAAAAEPSSVFSNGLALPPPPFDVKEAKSASMRLNHGGISHGVLGLVNAHCFAVMFPCMGGGHDDTE